MRLSHLLPFTGLLIGGLALAPSGWTQEPPPAEPTGTAEGSPETTPPEAPLVVPELPTDLGPLLLPRGPVRWVIRLRFRETWESNPLFEQESGAGPASEQSGDFVSHAALDLARRWTRQRSDFTISLNGEGALFARNDELSQASFGATARWNWRATPHTSLRAGADYDRNAWQRAFDAGQGLLLPRVTSQVLGGSVGADRSLGRRTRSSIDVVYRRVSFDSATMNDGDQLAGTARLERKTGGESALTGAYAYTLGSAREERLPRRSSHTFSLGWGGRLLRRLRLTGEVGVLYLPAWVQAKAKTMPAGAASLVFLLKGTRIEGSYEREAGEAFGYGWFRIADLYRLAWQQSLGRRVTWLTGASYGVSRDPADELLHLETIACSSTLSVSLGPRWVLAAGYGFARRDFRASVAWPSASTHTLNVNMSREWRR